MRRELGNEQPSPAGDTGRCERWQLDGRPTAAPPSAAPTASAATFDEIPLSGKGKKVVKFDIPENAAAIAVMTHKGEANFIVHALDGSGKTIGGLVNEIGNYKSGRSCSTSRRTSTPSPSRSTPTAPGRSP